MTKASVNPTISYKESAACCALIWLMSSISVSFLQIKNRGNGQDGLLSDEFRATSANRLMVEPAMFLFLCPP